jgi:hypothetical protein
MGDEILKSIEKKLDIVIKLLAVSSMTGKSKTENIVSLGALGIDKTQLLSLLALRRLLCVRGCLNIRQKQNHLLRKQRRQANRSE